MQFLFKIWRSNFLIRLRSWEYWPFGILYAPVFLYWLWLSLKARSLLYFTASNPSIENGGMLGESKYKILELLPESIKAKTLLFTPKMSLNVINEALSANNFNYPFICKPDTGERGYMVKKINSAQGLKEYLNKADFPFLVQEYINLPIEMGVFYYRYPNKSEGTVSSIVIKEMLTVYGDGKSTLHELIISNDRAKLQWKSLRKTHFDQLEYVLKPGESMQLVSIGNHCKGTKFLNGNHLINDTLRKTFDRISMQVEGFYFGRYDIRVASNENLYEGRIKIMELNGAGSEPSHIYQPGFSIWEAYKVVFSHWRVLYEISHLNHTNGQPYLSLKEGWKEYQRIRSLNIS